MDLEPFDPDTEPRWTPRTGGPISGPAMIVGAGGLTASRLAAGPPFERDDHEVFMTVVPAAPTPKVDIHERLHLVGGPPRFEQSPVVPDRALVRISARDIWQRGRDATLRPGATLRAAVMHLHDTTEPDGFVHNCIAHPLTWLTQRRWDR